MTAIDRINEMERVARLICQAMGEHPDCMVVPLELPRTRTGAYDLTDVTVVPNWSRYYCAAVAVVDDNHRKLANASD